MACPTSSSTTGRRAANNQPRERRVERIRRQLPVQIQRTRDTEREPDAGGLRVGSHKSGGAAGTSGMLWDLKNELGRFWVPYMTGVTGSVYRR